MLIIRLVRGFVICMVFYYKVSSIMNKHSFATGQFFVRQCIQ